MKINLLSRQNFGINFKINGQNVTPKEFKQTYNLSEDEDTVELKTKTTPSQKKSKKPKSKQPKKPQPMHTKPEPYRYSTNKTEDFEEDITFLNDEISQYKYFDTNKVQSLLYKKEFNSFVFKTFRPGYSRVIILNPKNEEDGKRCFSVADEITSFDRDVLMYSKNGFSYCTDSKEDADLLEKQLENIHSNMKDYKTLPIAEKLDETDKIIVQALNFMKENPLEGEED